jgi:DNA-binding MarR family transcriptional regulator
MSSQRRRDLIDEMSTAMRRFMAHAVFFQDAVARWADLNATDLQCAGLLVLDGPLTPSELAARTGLSSGGAITAVIDRLETAGLVHRHRDQVDRRRVLVTPDTDAIWQRVGPVYARVGGRWTEYLATLDDDQIALAVDVIRHAAAINRNEIDALRATPRQPNPPTAND